MKDLNDANVRGVINLALSGKITNGVAANRLGIEVITTSVSQTKERIERLWRTFQDRLVAEFRLNGIATIEQANAFMPGFIERYNARFSRTKVAFPYRLRGLWGKERQIKRSNAVRLFSKKRLFEMLFENNLASRA